MPLRALRRARLPIAAIAAMLLMPAAAHAASSGDDPVLVENSLVTIRKSDFDGEVDRLPAEIRPGFANSEKRVHELLRRMLLERTLAAQARSEKLAEVPKNAQRLAAEIDKLYAQLKVAQIEEAAIADFEAKRAAWEARARELYAVDRKRFEVPEKLQASHILFETRTRSRDDARKLADEARAKVVAGADFNKLARELSEDRSAKTNMGRLDWFARSEMDPAFADAAFALKAPGDISQPVLSSFGWHVIRLDARQPAVQRSFDEVRDEILADLRHKHVNEAREAAIAKLRNDPTIRANLEAIDALVVRTDRNAVRRAAQELAPGALPAPR